MWFRWSPETRLSMCTVLEDGWEDRGEFQGTQETERPVDESPDRFQDLRVGVGRPDVGVES